MNNIPLNEYPRPQMVRKSYMSLNGEWDFVINKSDRILNKYDGTILVPYSPECNEHIKHILQPDEFIIYRRFFTLPKDFNIGRVLLHFTAVDQTAKVFINNKYLGEHVGGYLPFDFDITRYLRESNELIVIVKDVSDTSYLSRGKQRLKRGGIWYTAQSGIWLPVWLESVPNEYIHSLKITPDIDKNCVYIKANSDEKYPILINFNEQKIEGFTNSAIKVIVDDLHLWSPEHPYLYDFTVQLLNDTVSSYFAMRKIETKKDEQGITRIYLNNEKYFINGVLDQGYFYKTLLTPPNDEAYIKDILFMKELGFNCLRKHIKIESLRYYYHCDRLGMLVWQDFVNGGTSYKATTTLFPLFTNHHHNDCHYGLFARKDKASRAMFYKESINTINYLYNCPCIVLWTIFNEGWGQFDAKRATEVVKSIDPTRLVDHASGWNDQKVSDVKSDHVYFKKYKLPIDSNDRAIVLSEFGGYHYKINSHKFTKKAFGYKEFISKDDLSQAIVDLYEEQIIPNIPKGLCACIYTQLSDVEDELNGFITFDRALEKINKYKIRLVNNKIKELKF